LLWQLTFQYVGQGFETQPNGSTGKEAADFVGERPNDRIDWWCMPQKRIQKPVTSDKAVI
jgi:hypothetical protein